MGTFITAKSRIEQTNIPKYWKTIDNELYLDDDSQLYLVPRYFWSDGYTFPGLVMAILGDCRKFDVRPAHQHDLFCRFHECIKVNISLTQLRRLEILRSHNGKIICEDIPKEYLEICPVSKKWTDDYFKQMMIDANVPKDKVNIMRFGVIFNFNWYFKTGKASLNSYDIFNEDIGLVNGL